MFDLSPRLKTSYSAIALIFILLSLFTIFTHIPKESFFARQADEGYYLKYSQQIFENGLGTYPQILENHVAIKNNWIWPSPLRVGYFLLSSTWFYICGASFVSLAYLSLFCFLLFLAVSFYFSRKYFGPAIGILYTMLLAFSPINMAMAKRALTDATGNLFTALSIWLFFEFLIKKKKLNFIIWLACFSYTILVREQSLLLVFGFGFIFLLYRYYYKEDISLKYLIPMAIVPPVIVVTTWLIFCQSPANILFMLKLTRYLPSVNNYSVMFCRGPWFRYIVDYILVSPLTSICALSFAVYAFFERSALKNFKAAYFLILFVIFYLLLSSFDYNKNIRYAINIDMFLRFFLVFFVYDLFKNHKEGIKIVFWMMVIFCVMDYGNFVFLFCNKGIYDPISFHLLTARRFIP
ncbi:MAG: glycosyltransferase family 39 protein [Candidatus Omnitrophota bacterium]